MTTKTQTFQAGLSPIHEGALTIAEETVTTFVVSDEAKKEVTRGTIGETGGIMFVKLITGQNMRLSVEQLEALCLLNEAWKKKRR